MSGLPFDLGDGAVIRRYTLDDADVLFAAADADRERLSEWLPWLEGMKTVEDERRWLEGALADPESLLGCGIWVGDELAGGVGLERDPFNVTVEIGYWLRSVFEGRGLVTRASRLLTEHAFTEFGVHKVVIAAGTNNVRSRAVPERLGFQEEAVLREEGRGSKGFYDLVVYGMLEDEWRALRT